MKEVKINKVLVEDVLKATSEVLNVEESRILGGGRDQGTVLAREVAMSLADGYSGLSKSEIADRFNCSMVTVYERIRSAMARASRDRTFAEAQANVAQALGLRRRIGGAMEIAEALQTLVDSGFQVSVHK